MIYLYCLKPHSFYICPNHFNEI
ncbi:unnamed protein product [Acanthoscelides obtectus]|uniref:Uncharacterized protein n=1 Tax=Acanthoscelides obtectus TaxID=200917 RepID=A0A9P0PAR7_ACAOB|nr:unnamed protein product [Acanthoscelides obtectus]CAK1668812.1 hypothetical protein AOBTE_LOCUS26620 [Acanthoscelides obtectus]